VLGFAAAARARRPPPVIALYASLGDQPDRWEVLDREFLEFATRSNRGVTGGPAEYHYEYLLVQARTRGGNGREGAAPGK